MKAIKIASTGGPEVLQLSDNEPMPQPGADEVLVKIHAAGVNFVDIYQRRGHYPMSVPFIPGLEAAGTVEVTGQDVTDFDRGDRVAYTGHLGSYSEYAAVPAKALIRLPKSLTFEDGAAFPLQGMTAHYLIHDFRKPRRGDTVLIHAAAGGVGLLLVQWAKHLHARVLGTVSTEAKADAARDAGADHVILYTKEDFVAATKRLTDGHGADLILDGVAKTTFPGDLEAVAEHGHIVVFGASSGTADPISPNSLMPRAISVSGGRLFSFIATPEALLRRSKDVLAGIKAGWLRLSVNHALPLADAEKAHRRLESRETMGKIVLKVVP